ncbi:MAG: RNA polymerase-binding protein RbpA [Rhodoluna sp.]|nr:RNA polymerase-binding protein RbpA [Rhodoluna sp.]
MSSGGSAIRGSRVGAGPMGEQYRGFKSERVERHYYCINGHTQSPQFAAHVDPAEIPDMIDCPNCGLPAGQDKKNPPEILKHEPYKTHLAYVKERRTSDEAKALLDEALSSIKDRRAKLAEAAKKQLKEEAARTAAAKALAAKMAAEKAKAAKAVKPVKPVKPAKAVKAVAKKAAKPVAKKPVAKKPAAKKSAPAKVVRKAAKAAPKAKATAKKTVVKKSASKVAKKK